MNIEQALEKFKTEVCARGAEIDPEGERDWYCLSVGYFIALGLSDEDVETAAIEARYTHEYWSN